MNYLWALHRLNIIDKHRLLVVATAGVSSSPATLELGAERAFVDGELVLRGQTALTNYAPHIGDGDEVFKMDHRPFAPPDDYDPKLSLQIAVHEPEFPWLREMGAIAFGRSLLLYIERAVFEPAEELLAGGRA